jgi:alpha-L-fucosidase
MNGPRPTEAQLRWQRAGFGLFLHFGVNTFNGVEWSDGTLPAASFDPTSCDPRQWVETAVAAGARYVVLTAKHHDGFCLWPTSTTDYSVRSSPWRGGRGDVVRLLTDACAEAGIGAGLYLSPWDRNADCYADPAAYDDFYAAQLTELCTRYGDLAELWFDGAGSEGREYDWDRYLAIVEAHQPDAMVFNLGRPTIRWVGNEDGLASDPVEYVTTTTRRSIDATEDDALPGGQYLPPECDVPVRANWFWQPHDLETLKSREHLLAIWYRSVGLGAGLLLGVPPDRRGLVDEDDRARLLEVTDELARRFDAPLPATLEPVSPGVVRASWPHPVRFDHLELREDLRDGQRVARHEVVADGSVVAAGLTVGVRRVHAFPVVTTHEVVVRLTDGARLESVAGHLTGCEAVPAPPAISGSW